MRTVKLELFRESFREFSTDKAPRLAAALAYYTLFSITPLLIIAITICGFVFGEEAARGEVFNQLKNLIGPQAAGAMQSMIQSAAARKDGGVWASIFSAILLLAGASGVVAHLKDSLDSMWCVPKKRKKGFLNLVTDHLVQVVVVLGIGLLLLALLAVSTALTGLSGMVDRTMPIGAWFWQAINFVISIGVVTGLFALIYRFIPDEEIDWKDVWTGAAFTAVLFTLGKFALGWYLGRGSVSSSYGAAGSLVILILWLYYSALIFFFGAEFTEVYARRERGVQTRQEKRESRNLAGSSGERHVPRPENPQRPARRRPLVSALAAGTGGLLAGLIVGVFAMTVALLRAGIKLFRI